MQIIKYEISNNILRVGFKETDIKNNYFVIYSDIGYNVMLTRQQLIQIAYEQVRKTIDYERKQTEHSITTNEIGEDFIPESPRVAKVKILDANSIFYCKEIGETIQQFTAGVYDQYGDLFNNPVNFSLDKVINGVSINKGSLVVGQVDSDVTLNLIAECQGIQDFFNIKIFKYVRPTTIPTIEDRISALEDAMLVII